MNSSKSLQIKEWNPQNILNGKDSFGVLILNQPLSDENILFLKENWNSAVVRVAVDGGANHLKEILENLKLPSIVCGDFDSITSENLKFFEKRGDNTDLVPEFAQCGNIPIAITILYSKEANTNLGVSIVPTPDQNETDFTKALKLTVNYIDENNLKVSSIVTVVRNGERLDHIFGNLNTLYLATQWTSIPVFILGNNSLTWLITEGVHKIQVPNTMRDCKIGLIPLGKACTNVTTTGLKWNLTNDKMMFGSLVSTSNRFDDNAKEVTISTETELIWTMEVKMNS